MKRFIWLALILCGALILPACSRGTLVIKEPEPLAGAQPTALQLQTLEPLAKPWITPSSIVAADLLGIKLIGKIKLSSVKPGNVMDTWTEDFIYPDRPDYNVNKGEPLTVNIENPSTSEISFGIFYTTPSSTTSDIDTGLKYEPAPAGSSNWVEFSTTQVNVPAQSIIHVPLRVIIPKVDGIPKRWEFGILVASMGGSFSAAGNQRWLISMR